MGMCSSTAAWSLNGKTSKNNFSNQNGHVGGLPWWSRFSSHKVSNMVPSNPSQQRVNNNTALPNSSNNNFSAFSCWSSVHSGWLSSSRARTADKFTLGQLPTRQKKPPMTSAEHSRTRSLIKPVFRKGPTARFTKSPEVWSFECEDQLEVGLDTCTGSPSDDGMSQTGNDSPASSKKSVGSVSSVHSGVSSMHSGVSSMRTGVSSMRTGASSVRTDVTFVSTVTRIPSTANKTDKVTVYPFTENPLTPTDPIPLQDTQDFTYYCLAALPPTGGGGRLSGMSVGRKVQVASMASSQRTLVKTSSWKSSIDNFSAYEAEILNQKLESLHGDALEHDQWSNLSSVTGKGDRHTRTLNELMERSSLPSRTGSRTGSTRHHVSSANRLLPISQQSLRGSTPNRSSVAYSEAGSSRHKRAHIEDSTPRSSTVHVEDSVSQSGERVHLETGDEGTVNGDSLIGTDNTLEDEVLLEEPTEAEHLLLMSVRSFDGQIREESDEEGDEKEEKPEGDDEDAKEKVKKRPDEQEKVDQEEDHQQQNVQVDKEKEEDTAVVNDSESTTSGGKTDVVLEDRDSNETDLIPKGVTVNSEDVDRKDREGGSSIVSENKVRETASASGDNNESGQTSEVSTRASSATGATSMSDVIIAAATEVLLVNRDATSAERVKRLLRAFRQGNSLPVKSSVTDFGELSSTLHHAFTEAFQNDHDGDESPAEPEDIVTLDQLFVEELYQLINSGNLSEDPVRALVQSYQQKTNMMRVRALRALLQEKQQQRQQEDIQLEVEAKQLLDDLDNARRNIQDLRGEERKRFDTRLMQKIRNKLQGSPDNAHGEPKRRLRQKGSSRKHKSHNNDPPGTAPAALNMDLPHNSPTS